MYRIFSPIDPRRVSPKEEPDKEFIVLYECQGDYVLVQNFAYSPTPKDRQEIIFTPSNRFNINHPGKVIIELSM